jgi:FkbM family methyltransferase
VAGVIDDFYSPTRFHGVPVIRTSDTPKDAIAVATMLGRPKSARAQLLQNNIAGVDYFMFDRTAGLHLPHARFWTGFSRATEINRHKLARIRNKLADEKSCDIFDKIIQFRLTADINFLDNFYENQKNQYFEDFLKLSSSGESFADVGCFDGATSEAFSKVCPKFVAINIFEPDPTNYEVVKKRFNNDSRIRCHQFGLGETEGTVFFTSSGSTSAINPHGEIAARIRTLDSFDLDELTFLKMDIEGAEIPAIVGATESIQRHHPRLAIAVYHHSDDLWRIPELILQIRDDYDLHIRHYTEGVTETIMFFIPRK